MTFDSFAGVLATFECLAAGIGRRSRSEPAHDDQFYIDTLRAVVRRGRPVRLQPDDAARILRIIEGRTTS